MQTQRSRHVAAHEFPSVPSTPIYHRIDQDTSSTVTDGELSPRAEDRKLRAGSVLSMDDPDVRLAAEALGDLRADFIHSPPQHRASISTENQDHTLVSPTSSVNGDRRGSQQPEPLLSLLTTSHPLLSTAINGSLSAYSTSKSYSPRFKTGAEFVERHIGSPVANTVGTMGRRTGVEGGVRWWLGSRRPSAAQQESEDEEGETANKRRKVGDSRSGSMDLERGLYMGMSEYGNRRPSQLSFESLPAYDDNRSPKYEPGGALVATQQSQDVEHSPPSSTWQSRLMLSTSGLGVAMSEESLRSLKYCLTWLRWANIHLGKVIIALKGVLEEWEQSQEQSSAGTAATTVPAGSITNGGTDSETSKSLITRTPQDEAILTQRVQALKSDVLQTLKKVVDVVSKYAGGALPENARILVRRHLTSLPQRFHIASNSGPMSDSLQPASATVSSANRVMVLAKEGLDMMAQVSGVLDGTIVSAEEWCDRLGRRKRGEPDDDTFEQRKRSRNPDFKDREMWKSDEKTTGEPRSNGRTDLTLELETDQSALNGVPDNLKDRTPPTSVSSVANSPTTTATTDAVTASSDAMDETVT